MGKSTRMAAVPVSSRICLRCPQLCHIRIDELFVATTAGGVHSARMRTAPSDVQLVAGRVRVCKRRRRAHAAATPLTTADSSTVLFLQRLIVSRPFPAPFPTPGKDDPNRCFIGFDFSFAPEFRSNCYRLYILFIFAMRFLMISHPQFNIIIMSSNVCLQPHTASRALSFLLPSESHMSRAQPSQATNKENHMDHVCVYKYYNYRLPDILLLKLFLFLF